MLRKIKICKSPSADTRSADHTISPKELLESTRQHIRDVQNAARYLSEFFSVVAEMHDFTKITDFPKFYEQFHKAQLTGDWGTGWYDEIHVVQERHHLKDRCPEDVNMLDVLEHICDIVTAGLARSGKFTPDDLDPKILLKAYQNTAKLLVEQIEVTE